MRLTTILICLSLAFLQACGPKSKPTGRPDEIAVPQLAMPAAARRACADPQDLLGDGPRLADDAVGITRIGDALIDCDRARALAVSTADRQSDIYMSMHPVSH